MGIYLNPDNQDFYMSYNDDIYVDKSMLIEYTNSRLNKASRFICVSRPRRFGKSTDANMLVAYYSRGCDSHELFNALKVSKLPDYEKHLNQHHVIHLNMQEFLSDANSITEMIDIINKEVMNELLKEYDVDVLRPSLKNYLNKIYNDYKESFIFIIDEWDCIFREYTEDKDAQKIYLDFLRDLLKDKKYVSLAYMTGILPIKKYGTHSALNMFKEISMVSPDPIEKFMGFTEEEVKKLCEEYQIDFDEMKAWYDGYHLNKEVSILSPRSVVFSLMDRKFKNYWASTETYESLKVYIDMNFDGLKDDIIKLLARKRVIINASKFQNDMTTFQSKDDVFTLLVHLGYLGYDEETSEVYIPNNEVVESFVNSIEDSNWGPVSESLRNSMNLIQATYACDGEQVAEYIEKAHLETSILQYNDENALAYTIYLAYIMARNDYTMVREFPGGKGFADVVFIPRYDKPAMIIELKYDKDVDTAIKQIKDKKYFFGLEKYLDNLLLVGINYDKETKKHTCMIEKYSNQKN
ncbi:MULTISPECIES: AAA family ATPase [Erysipelotrichaceae]|uniref:AAA family ATPase n=3 Tax=Erysipelotrichaceae TaxID=128827 RepID=A0A7G9GRN4_9FIRM|nr:MULTISPECIES: AAA family ATPase [Erysipelotrichaceae]QNM13466.1 AAA family ATPase [[Eubacterium] hominis]MCH4286320.1 ATP-binding protein [Amedibacillus hominis]RGB51701.1 AAA family ATPase [Absiella sp. AM22-9]RGB68512.1 AAA family ATPase [Absiella sp. AM09-45]RGB78379.1 AAA family ATPase [Absiella sp. AM09-50]